MRRILAFAFALSLLGLDGALHRSAAEEFASGGVGIATVQVAVSRGLRVVATAPTSATSTCGTSGRCRGI